MSSKIFEQIVESRGIENLQKFIDPDYKDLHDPLLLPDIQAALKRLDLAIKNDETVGIFGDYDIDGLTAVALLHEAFTAFGLKSVAFIPDRFVDGYGMSKRGIDELHSQGVNLIVTVDCGSRSEKEVAYAKSLGIDTIVSDHHNIDEPLKNAVATINPKRNDSQYPFAQRAGAGVAFGLVQAMQTRFKGLTFDKAKWLLDLVALATISDVVDLRGENRILTIYGLKVFNQTKRPGLQALIKQAFGNNQRVIDETDIGFGLAPRLNAAGRLIGAETALKTLLCKEEAEAEKLAIKLNQLNASRRQEQRVIFKEASAKAAKFAEDRVLVLHAKNWSHGINGIVAAKLVETYSKPTFVMQDLDDGTTKGSARSISGFSLGQALKEVKRLLISGGGHELAAGATIKTTDVDEFREQLNDFYDRSVDSTKITSVWDKYDLQLTDFKDLNLELAEKIASLKPYGQGNPQPLFLFTNVKVVEHRPVGVDGDHAKLKLQDTKGTNIEAIGFRLSTQFAEHATGQVDLLAGLEKNEFNGRVNVQLVIKAVKPKL